MFEHPGGDATRGDLQPLVPSIGLMPGCSSGGSSPGNVVEVARAGSVLLVPGIVPLLMSVAPSDGGPGRGAVAHPGEVALFRVDPKTVTRCASAGRIGSIRTPGGHRRFRESEIHDLLIDLTVDLSPSPP